MKPDALHLYFTAVAGLRRFFLAEEAVCAAWEKTRKNLRWLWALPAVCGAAALAAVLLPRRLGNRQGE